MRFGKRAALWALCAGPAVAAMVVTGAGAANAAATTPAAHKTASTRHFPYYCNPWQLERWDLNGDNTVNAVYQGHTFTYTVHFRQDGSCLGGQLTDTYWPGTLTGPIYGTVSRNHVTFSFTYPSTGHQGTRTFTGTINRYGAVAGTWSETGSENGSGTWALGTNADQACPPWWRIWRAWRGCHVRSW